MVDSQESDAAITADELKNLINDTALYILHDERPFNLIKRQDIVKNILKEKKKHYLDVVNGVRVLLRETLDLELVEIEKNKTYSVFNRLNYDCCGIPEDVEADRNLLGLVLTVIFMNNGALSESALFSFLKHINIMTVKQDKKHTYFGDVENAIKKKFTKYGFLECNLIPGTDPPENEFHWGKRAEIEVDKKAVLDFACKVMGEQNPENWEKQSEEVEEQRRARLNLPAQ